MRLDCEVMSLSDTEVLTGITQIAGRERQIQYEFLCYLFAVSKRKLYAVEGYPTLVAFIEGYLGYSYSSALKRSQIVERAAQVPYLYDAIRERKLSMSAAQKLCPYLYPENCEALIDECAGKSVNEVERIIVRHFPQSKTDAIRQRVSPVSIDEVFFQFTGPVRMEAKLKKIQELLSHKYPEGRIAEIFEDGLDELLEKVDKTAKPAKEGASKITRVILEEGGHQSEALDSRYTPKDVERALWERDQEQCTYVSASGHRCEARRFLQIDHIKPWALGGSSKDLKNLRLLCATHNRLRASETFVSPFAEAARIQKEYFQNLEKMRAEQAWTGT